MIRRALPLIPRLPQRRLPLCLCTVLALSAANAHAYMDPGSGSFLLQILLAAFVGAMFYFRQGMDAIKRFFSRIFGKKQ